MSSGKVLRRAGSTNRRGKFLWIAFVFGAGVLCVPTRANAQIPKADAKFTEMNVTFHTTTDDKDHDTRVEVFIVQVNGSPALAYLDIGGGNKPHVPNSGFPNNSTSMAYLVPTFGPGFRFQDLKNLKLQLLVKMTPSGGGGNDNWKFWADAKLHFADGTTAVVGRTPEVYPHAVGGRPQSELFDLSNAVVQPK